MADAVRYPSAEDRVCAAVALGWEVAALYHSPVHRGPVADPPRAARLPGYSGFSPATHARWLGEQIAATAGRLITDPPQALTDALSGALAWLWQTELDESVAQAATRLPPPAQPRRITGSAAGAMALSGTELHPAGELPAAPAAT